jgi:hypothetical protein
MGQPSGNGMRRTALLTATRCFFWTPSTADMRAASTTGEDLVNRRDLYIFLGLEFFGVVWAGAVFSLVSTRPLAAALAGGYFVLSAFYMYWRAWNWPDRWRSASIYPLTVHLWGFSLPMVITRFLHAGDAFTDVRIWGLSGPLFHRLSSWVFMCLILCTFIDLARVQWRQHPRKSRRA